MSNCPGTDDCIHSKGMPPVQQAGGDKATFFLNLESSGLGKQTVKVIPKIIQFCTRFRLFPFFDKSTVQFYQNKRSYVLWSSVQKKHQKVSEIPIEIIVRDAISVSVFTSKPTKNGLLKTKITLRNGARFFPYANALFPDGWILAEQRRHKLPEKPFLHSKFYRLGFTVVSTFL